MTLTIVTVVYNCKENVLKTLQNIRKQSFQDFEFIVVDGKSTDGTYDVLKENQDLIDVLISEPDKGLYDAMNKGKHLATKDFVLFMNAGDIFANEKVIANLIPQLEEPDKLYYGNTIVYFDNDFRIAPIKHHQSVFFPRSYFTKHDYDIENFKVAAEGDYIMRASTVCEEKHIDIDIILSKIDGLRVQMYDNIEGMRSMYQEVKLVMSRYKGKVPLSYKLTYPFKSILKYFVFKIGGLELVAKLLLSSYKKTNKQYEVS